MSSILGTFALRTYNGHYLSANQGGGSGMTADRSAPGPWETFTLHGLNDGTLRLQASNSHYVCAERGGGEAVNANRAVAAQWETFSVRLSLAAPPQPLGEPDPGSGLVIIGNPGPTPIFQPLQPGSATSGAALAQIVDLATQGTYGICLQTSDKTHFLSAMNGGGSTVSANSTNQDIWETFTLVPMAGETLAFSACNGQYVAALQGGGGSLIAQSTEIGTWERFKLVKLPGGKVGLRTWDGRYASVNQNNGTIVAVAFAIGVNESFTFVDLGNGKFALKAANNKYVCAENQGADPLIAKYDSVGEWETFQRITSVVLRVSRGGNDDVSLYCAQLKSDGAMWGPAKPFPQGNLSWCAPALANFRGRLYCVHRGAGSRNSWTGAPAGRDLNMFWCTYDPQTMTWSADTQFTNGNMSDSAPALAEYGNKLYCVHKGQDNWGIWWGSFDPQTMTWSADRQLLQGNQTGDGPALAVYRGTLYCVHRGRPGSKVMDIDTSSPDYNLYWCTFDPQTETWSEDKRFTNDSRCCYQPSLAVLNDVLYCVHPGMGGHGFGGDTDIYWSAFDPSSQTWGAERALNNDASTSFAVGVVAANNRLYITFPGEERSQFAQSLYWCTLDPVSGTVGAVQGVPGVQSADAATMIVWPIP